MLRELRNAKQVKGEPHRRWFFCHELDLVVWFDPDGAPRAFQLAYDKYVDEHSISWHRDRGFAHYIVDDGDSRQLGSQTPFLFANGLFERDRVLSKFKDLAGELPPEVTAFVTDKLSSFDESTPS